MGQTPSKALLQAAEFGNVGYCNRALIEGADVNTRAKRNHDTPLILASRNGHLDIVKILLQKNARDSQNITGSTPLIEAAKRNRCAILALLLDYGCDPFRQNSNGKTALELATERKHVKALRLIEARTCSFYAHIQIEKFSWFSKRYTKQWVTVQRRRPWDNPSINPTNVTLCIYSSLSSYRPEVRIARPRIESMNRDGMNVSFILTGNVVWVHDKIDTSHNSGPRPYRCKVTYDIFAWLERVIHDSFIQGRGSPAFDPVSGCIYMPISAAAYATQFTTQAVLRTVAGRDYEERGNQVMALPPGFVTDTRTLVSSAPTVLPPPGQAAAPPRSSSQSLPTSPQIPIIASHSYSPPPMPMTTTTSAAAPAAPPQRATKELLMSHRAEPTYLTQAMRQLMSRIINDEIHFSDEIPEEFRCPITTEIMVDPVVCSDGHTYSREGIATWIDTKVKYALELQQQQALQRNVVPETMPAPVVQSPITGEPLDDFRLIPNHLLRSRVLEWVEKHQIVDASDHAPFRNTAASHLETDPTVPVKKGVSMSLDLDRSSTPQPVSTYATYSAPTTATADANGSTSAVAVATDVTSSSVYGNPSPSPLDPSASARMNRLDSVSLITSDDWVFVDKDAVPAVAVAVNISDGSLATLMRTAPQEVDRNALPSAAAGAAANLAQYPGEALYPILQLPPATGVEPSAVYISQNSPSLSPSTTNSNTNSAALGSAQRAVVVPVDLSAFYATSNRSNSGYMGEVVGAVPADSRPAIPPDAGRIVPQLSQQQQQQQQQQTGPSLYNSMVASMPNPPTANPNSVYVQSVPSASAV